LLEGSLLDKNKIPFELEAYQKTHYVKDDVLFFPPLSFLLAKISNDNLSLKQGAGVLISFSHFMRREFAIIFEKILNNLKYKITLCVFFLFYREYLSV